MPTRAMVFNDSLEWVGIGHHGHPRGAVAMYLFHVIYQNASTTTTERKVPKCVDETTIKEHSDQLRIKEIEATLCRRMGK